MRLSYAIASVLTIGNSPLLALELPDCQLAPGQAQSCVPIVACMPEDGVYLVGRAIGWNIGTLKGVTNTGVSCTGNWSVSESLRFGHARFACDDGLSGRMIYHYQDSLTGTARGTGLVSGFGRITAWSGYNIRAYLDRSGARVDDELLYGQTPMLLGAAQAAASSAKSR